MDSVGTINIPHWLNRALIVRGLGPGTTLDYPRLREVFSFEQRVELLMAQSVRFAVFKSDEVGASPHVLLDHWGNRASDELAEEVRTIEREATKRLQQGQTLLEQFSDNTAELVSEGRTFNMQPATTVHVEAVFLEIDNGFKSLTLQDYFELSKQLISNCYKFGRSHRVQRSQVFRLYLGLMHKLGR